MTAYAVFVLLAGMIAGWALRRATIAVLRDRHPAEFARLGEPTGKQLLSHMPRHREMHLALFRFVWGFEFRAFPDALVRALAWATVLADLAMIAGALLLFFFAART